MKENTVLQLASFVLLFIVWTISALLGDATVLPSPVTVFERIVEEISQGKLLFHCAVTLLRVGAAFVLALVLGSVLGIAMGINKSTDSFFDPWLLLFLNVPALVIIVLSYIWIGLGETAAIVAVTINKLPNVAVTMREGARALDRQLAEMAQVYKLSFYRRMRFIVLPQLAPYLLASARSGLALVWKIVLVVELLGRSNGVGFQLHLYFQLFDVAGIMAYSLVFIAIVYTIEHLLMRPLDSRLNVWRAS